MLEHRIEHQEQRSHRARLGTHSQNREEHQAAERGEVEGVERVQVVRPERIQRLRAVVHLVRGPPEPVP